MSEQDKVFVKEKINIPAYRDPKTVTTREYVGKDVNRHDGYEKVTGVGRYTDDFTMTGMLHASLVTSPYAHAEVVSIDISAAEKLPGVRSIVTGKDTICSTKVGIYIQDRSIMACDRARYFGEVVAAVAADTKEIAETAARLIKVEYKELPVIQDVRESIKPETMLIHKDLADYPYTKGMFFPQPGTNVASKVTIKRGNLEQAFKEADHIVENTYSQPQIFHLPIETHNLIVEWRPNDQVKIITSAQSPFSVRDLFAVTFGLSKNNVEVIVPYVGGGFGGKSGIHLEPVAGLLSKAAGGRPVKLNLTREEECTVVPCRQGLVANVKTGVMNDGSIIAQDIEYLWDAGAYADYGVNIGRAGAVTGVGPYYIPNVKVESKTVYTNHLFGTAFRGFSHPEVFFALERQMDLVAKTIKMDPNELRKKNLLKVGQTTITGEMITENTGNPHACLDQVLEGINYYKEYTAEEKAEMKRTGKYRGKSATILQKSPAMPTWSASSAVLHMNEDGGVLLSVGGIDMGQGTYTVFRQMVAEKLNMPIEKVLVNHEVNTNLSPYDWQTVASRMVVLGGNAVLEACDDLINQIYEIAGIALRAARHELAIGDQCVYVKQKPQFFVDYSKIAIGYSFPDTGSSMGGPLIGRGKAIAQGLTILTEDEGQGLPALDWTYGAHAMEVEVDIHTGDVQVLQLASSMDVGKVLNTKFYEGQVMGGAVQSIGAAFSEAIYYDDKGRMLTTNFTDYKIPSIRDIPTIQTVTAVETPQLDGPYGARGVGEHPTISITPAVANGIANATGVEVLKTPLSSENVYFALQEQFKQS